MKAAWCELTMLSYSYVTLPGKQVKGSEKHLLYRAVCQV
jgi:hypothetical protein